MFKISCERCINKLCAKKVSIFADLTDEENIKIIQMTGEGLYGKGDTICHEGEPSNTLYILNEGQIKLTKITRDGKEQIVRLLKSGDFFGELSLFTENEINNVTAYATSQVKICTLSKENMTKVLDDNPEISLKLLGTISTRLAKLEDLAQNLATNDAEVRTAVILIELSEKYSRQESGNIIIDLPLNREELANYAGLTRETMSRKLKMFKDLGIIELIGTKQIKILDLDRLKEYI